MSPKTLPVVIAALFAAYAQAEEAKPPERNTTAKAVEAEGKIAAVVVRGSRNTPRQSCDNYTVKGSTSAAKLDLKLKETPQSLSVFTQQQMQDQNLKSLNDILEETPGITVINDSIPGVSDAEYYSRGFPVDNYRLDGVMVNKKNAWRTCRTGQLSLRPSGSGARLDGADNGRGRSGRQHQFRAQTPHRRKSRYAQSEIRLLERQAHRIRLRRRVKRIENPQRPPCFHAGTRRQFYGQGKAKILFPV